MAEIDPKNGNSWLEYRRLVLQSLQELKSDVEKVKERLASLEKYADLKQDVDKISLDLAKFVKNYEREMTTVKVKQAMLISGIATVISVAVSILTGN